MPEASVNEDRPAARSIREIWGAWQVSVLNSVTMTLCADEPPHEQLHCGPMLPDSREPH
jgi:hypothetical protein